MRPCDGETRFVDDLFPIQMLLQHNQETQEDTFGGEEMYVMGTNTWDFDVPTKGLVKMALKFADEVKQNGIAELRDACLDPEKKLLWCTWETENLEGLQAAFDQMNKESGLKSELHEIEIFFP
jgi:hypothetical protein